MSEGLVAMQGFPVSRTMICLAEKGMDAVKTQYAFRLTSVTSVLPEVTCVCSALVRIGNREFGE